MSDTPPPPPPAPRRRRQVIAPLAPAGVPDLTDRLRELTDSVDGLRQAVDEERAVRADEIDATKRKFETAQRARKRSNLALGVAVGAALLGALVSGWLAIRSMRETDARERDRVRAAVVTCENGNVTRAAIEARFQSLIDALIAAAAPPATMEEAEARKERIDRFRAQFANDPAAAALAARNCSPRAASEPASLTTTVTAGG